MNSKLFGLHFRPSDCEFSYAAYFHALGLSVVQLRGTLSPVNFCYSFFEDSHRRNADSADELWSIFARTSLVICQPDSAQFRCPPRMHIRPLLTSVLTEPGKLSRNENVSPHCFRSDMSHWTKDPRQQNKLIQQCRHADEHEVSDPGKNVTNFWMVEKAGGWAGPVGIFFTILPKLRVL